MIRIIAKDGSGDYITVQAAIDAVPEGNREPVILLLRMDEYHERVIVNKDNVRLVGEARDRTVITWSACAKDLNEEGKEKGTFLSYTMLVTGENVEVENLTIRNDAGFGHEVGQAVAVYAAGDRGVWRNCVMSAHQDTLFCGPTMPKVQKDALPRKVPEGVESVGDCPMVYERQYFEKCIIRGDVDFIFGPYRCWFEQCELIENIDGGIYTAANTPEEAEFGMVFHQCKLTGECGEGKAFLGRPWRKFARTVFLECEMDEHVAPEGFVDWDAEKKVTERYAEFGTRGARADLSERNPAEKILSAEEAAAYTIERVMDGWHPETRVPTWFVCAAEGMPELEGEGHLVEDCAAAGMSSKKFVAEKWLNFVELCLRPGDKMFVRFGKEDAKADRSVHTSARTTYLEYLNMYVDAAKRQRSEIVIVEDPGAPEAYRDAAKDLAEIRGVKYEVH